MKKLGKFLLVGALAATVAAGTIGFAACGNSGETYTGDYHYDSWGHTYGVKVEVVVDGDTIKSVKVVDSDYVQLSDAVEGTDWTDAKRKNYTDNEASLLKSFKGKKVADVKNYTVTKNGDVPSAVTAEGISVITDATQSTGRIILAVQDALKDVK